MEKYTKFRDRGSGIAPFFPVTADSSTYLALQVLLFCVRLPLLISVSTSYFLFLQWLPLGALARKAMLWLILGIPGIWWVDLQIDGVKRGSLGQNLSRLPQGRTVIAATFTSPLDALYLGAVFDGIFTLSYPGTRLVEQTSLLGAIFHALSHPRLRPAPGARLVELGQILDSYPVRPIVVFPECTTTNGRGVLQLSPSILSAPPGTKVFPVSLRYNAADITTPIPHCYIKFVWDLLSAPTHSLRVRIAEAVHMASPSSAGSSGSQKGRNGFNVVNRRASASEHDEGESGDDSSGSSSDNGDQGGYEMQRQRSWSNAELNSEEKKVLDVVGEHLARLGRAKYLGLSVHDKEDFLNVWQAKKR